MEHRGANERRTTRRIVVDLRQSSSLPALVALGHCTQRTKVKSALIEKYGTYRVSLQPIMKALGQLPNLCTLTVDLDRKRLSVGTLVVLVKSVKGLRDLTLKNAVFTGTLCDQIELERTLVSPLYCNIRRLSLSHCQGTAVVSAFLTKTTSLKMLRISNCRISQCDMGGGASLVQMFQQNLGLRCLTLESIPDLEDKHLVQLSDSMSDRNNNHIEGFHIISSNIGQEAGEALANLLLSWRSRISQLTLNLGREWSTIGYTFASVLSSSNASSLTSLQLRLTGSDLDGHDIAVTALQIGDALRLSRTRLTRLEFNVDLDTFVGFGHDSRVLRFYEDVLRTNHLLQDLRFFDSCRESGIAANRGHSERTNTQHLPEPTSLPMTPYLKMKLTLNGSGLSTMIHESLGENRSPLSLASYVQAIYTIKDDISCAFYAISRNPTLFAVHENGYLSPLPAADGSPSGEDGSPYAGSFQRTKRGKQVDLVWLRQIGARVFDERVIGFREPRLLDATNFWSRTSGPQTFGSRSLRKGEGITRRWPSMHLCAESSR
jgi:hypothetical protein